MPQIPPLVARLLYIIYVKLAFFTLHTDNYSTLHHLCKRCIRF